MKKKPSEEIAEIAKKMAEEVILKEYPYEHWESRQSKVEIELRLNLTDYMASATVKWLDEHFNL